MSEVSDTIIAQISMMPANGDGWRNFDWQPIREALPGKSDQNLHMSFLHLMKKGIIVGQKKGRVWDKVKLAQDNSVATIREGTSGTERMLHYLFGLASPKGDIPASIDTRHLMKALGIDAHDVNKSLHNLNKLGILSYKESTEYGSNDRKKQLTHLRLRLERQKDWPIDMLGDEDLPGRTDPEEVTEVVDLGQEEMDELAAQTDEPETVVVGVQPATSSSGPDFNPEDYPGIVEAIKHHNSRAHALAQLKTTGDEDLADLIMERIREENPLISELIRLLATLGYYGG